MCADEEIAVEAGHVAQRAALDQTPNAPYAGDEAAVLHHSMDTPRRLGLGNHRFGFNKARRHGLFGQHVTAVAQPDFDQTCARRGHNHIKQQIGFRLVEDGVQIHTDNDVIEAEFAGAAFCNCPVEIDETDHPHPALEQGMLGQGRQPAFGHAAATGEHRRIDQDVLPLDFALPLPSCAASGQKVP